MDTLFFAQSARREVHLRSVAGLVAANEVKQIKLALSMPLTGQSLVGMPSWLGDAHDAVAKSINSATIDARFDDMNLDIFATDQTDARQIQLPKAQLGRFHVIRTGDAEVPDITLCFVAYVAFASAAWAWAGEMSGHNFYIKFDPAQMEMPLEPADGPLASGQMALDRTDYTAAHTALLHEAAALIGDNEIAEDVIAAMNAPEEDSEPVGIGVGPNGEDRFPANPAVAPRDHAKEAEEIRATTKMLRMMHGPDIEVAVAPEKPKTTRLRGFSKTSNPSIN